MKDHPSIKTTILEIFPSYVSVIVNELLTKDHPSFRSFERTFSIFRVMLEDRYHSVCMTVGLVKVSVLLHQSFYGRPGNSGANTRQPDFTHACSIGCKS